MQMGVLFSCSHVWSEWRWSDEKKLYWRICVDPIPREPVTNPFFRGYCAAIETCVDVKPVEPVTRRQR